MDPLFDVLAWSWDALSSVFWVTAYLVPTWFTAYVLRMTAPQRCPDGLEYSTCHEDHPFHVFRNDTRWCVVLGFVWPLWLVVSLAWAFTKSVQGAAAITPTPTPKHVNTDRMLEQADSEFEEMKEETSQQVDRIIEGNVHWTPPPPHR